jgi:hypothetical protein
MYCNKHKDRKLLDYINLGVETSLSEMSVLSEPITISFNIFLI